MFWDNPQNVILLRPEMVTVCGAYSSQTLSDDNVLLFMSKIAAAH